MSELRQSMLLDTELAASKRRFGLFSQPPSTAIGDDSPFKQRQGTPLPTQHARAPTESPSHSRATCCPAPIGLAWV
jgi:hypothetical protein